MHDGELRSILKIYDRAWIVFPWISGRFGAIKVYAEIIFMANGSFQAQVGNPQALKIQVFFFRPEALAWRIHSMKHQTNNNLVRFKRNRLRMYDFRTRLTAPEEIEVSIGVGSTTARAFDHWTGFSPQTVLHSNMKTMKKYRGSNNIHFQRAAANVCMLAVDSWIFVKVLLTKFDIFYAFSVSDCLTVLRNWPCIGLYTDIEDRSCSGNRMQATSRQSNMHRPCCWNART